MLGKTFTVDPISKRRLYNFGEEDQFYIREHHEPIISEEVFEAAYRKFCGGVQSPAALTWTANVKSSAGNTLLVA